MASFPGNSAWTRAEDAVIAQFRVEHPHIAIQREGYQQSIEQTLTAAPPPDIMLTATIYALNQAMAQGHVMDVTELWADSGLVDGYPAAFQQLSQYDGKQFFVPVGYPWSAIYYNRALFEELGLAPPQTWDEFMILCEQLRSQGITPLSLSSGDPSVGMMWFEYLNLRLNGPEFHRQLLQGAVSFEDVRVLEVLETWYMLFANGYFAERVANVSNLDSLMALVVGDAAQGGRPSAAMLLTHSAVLIDLPPDFRSELDFFRFPILDPSLPIGEAFVVYGYMIPQAAQQPETARTFLAHLASPAAQALIAQNLNSTAVIYAPTNAAPDADDVSPALQKGMALVTDAADIAPFFLLSLPDSMANEVGMALLLWLRQPSEVQTFAQALERARQNALAQNLLTPAR